MLSKTAEAILEKRYLLRNANGEVIETTDQLFRRVAKAVAEPEGSNAAEYEEKFYALMTSLDFLPNSPTLMNAGTPGGQLSACFVLPIEDSMEGIFNTLRDAALIHKTGGGTGFSFSRLRPKDSVVKSTGGIASGPISFMHAYNAATEAIKQGGKRRGANMGMLRVDHPDILDFIKCKKDKTKLTNFNISVAITDKFMQAVQEDSTYELFNPYTKKVEKELPARYVWDEIVKAAWESGEPGIFFIDRANQFNPTPMLGEFEATNPCGEQPLLPYESCNLGSINLGNMVINGRVDYTRLARTIELAVRFLDNVIEINKYPLPQIERATKLTRKIGLGVMGWADMLLKRRIPYNSKQAIDLAEQVMKFITTYARICSIHLGKERGSFPAKDKSIWKDYEYMRNAALTTIAPTGTISMIAEASSGIEPIFGYAYTKTVMDNTSFTYVNEILKETLEERGLYTQEIIDKLLKTGRVSTIEELPEDIKEIFVCAYDITAEDHIKMQAAFQKYTDNAISKTINFPKDATIEDIHNGYLLAYKLGCKGVTVYRDGSRDSQVLNIGTETKKSSEPASKALPRDRATTTFGFTDKITTGCGNLYITVNFDEHGICEVFTNTGKAGGCPSQSEASARLATLALRSNIDLEAIIKQLSGIRCPAAIQNKNAQCLSCPDAIARTLRKALGHKVPPAKATVDQSSVSKAFDIPSIDQPIKAPIVEPIKAPLGPLAKVNPKKGAPSTGKCPECGQPIYNAEGCVICQSCGYSKCN